VFIHVGGVGVPQAAVHRQSCHGPLKQQLHACGVSALCLLYLTVLLRKLIAKRGEKGERRRGRGSGTGRGSMSGSAPGTNPWSLLVPRLTVQQ